MHRKMFQMKVAYHDVIRSTAEVSNNDPFLRMMIKLNSVN